MYGGCVCKHQRSHGVVETIVKKIRTLSQLRLQKEVPLVGRSTTCGLCSGIVGHCIASKSYRQRCRGETNPRPEANDEDITSLDMTILMACKQKVNQSYIMIIVATFDELMLRHDVCSLSFSEIHTWIKKSARHTWKA